MPLDFRKRISIDEREHGTVSPPAWLCLLHLLPDARMVTISVLVTYVYPFVLPNMVRYLVKPVPGIFVVASWVVQL